MNGIWTPRSTPIHARSVTAANVHAKLRIIHAWCVRTSPERIAR